MILTVSTRDENANELGYLFNKHPNRPQAYDLPFGRGYVFFPVCNSSECTIALVLGMDPVGLVRKHSTRGGSMPLAQYVNDRPYVCSSFMSVALAKIFPQALNGKCSLRPELAGKKFGLEARLVLLRSRGGEGLVRRLFEPLGYSVEVKGSVLDERFPEWGSSNYYDVTLRGSFTVRELLVHAHVLVPVLDNQKHYYIDEAEIGKLLRRGEGWLSSHPEKGFIATRYLKHKTSYAREALSRLEDEGEVRGADGEAEEKTDEYVCEREMSLNDERYMTVLSVLKAEGARSVIDLGCGDCRFLSRLIAEKQFEKIAGMDVSIRSLEIGKERLHFDDLPPAQRERIALFQGSLTYRDTRICGFDAVSVIEVIEHLDAGRLAAFERIVFGTSHAKTIVITTPNKEYNRVWEGLSEDSLRHPDHRFEWTRKEFENWASRVANEWGYDVRFVRIGTVHPEWGSPSQAAVFGKREGGVR